MAIDSKSSTGYWAFVDQEVGVDDESSGGCTKGEMELALLIGSTTALKASMRIRPTSKSAMSARMIMGSEYGKIMPFSSSSKKQLLVSAMGATPLIVLICQFTGWSGFGRVLRY
ncbi:unnamed protein product [Prunus brigantina]